MVHLGWIMVALSSGIFGIYTITCHHFFRITRGTVIAIEEIINSMGNWNYGVDEGICSFLLIFSLISYPKTYVLMLSTLSFSFNRAQAYGY